MWTGELLHGNTWEWKSGTDFCHQYKYPHLVTEMSLTTVYATVQRKPRIRDASLKVSRDGIRRLTLLAPLSLRVTCCIRAEREQIIYVTPPTWRKRHVRHSTNAARIEMRGIKKCPTITHRHRKKPRYRYTATYRDVINCRQLFEKWPEWQGRRWT